MNKTKIIHCKTQEQVDTLFESSGNQIDNYGDIGIYILSNGKTNGFNEISYIKEHELGEYSIISFDEYINNSIFYEIY